MSTVFDVAGVSVNSGELSASIGQVSSVAVQVNTSPERVTVIADTAVDVIQIATPGVQGPPGVKNVYIQPNDPSIEFGWGMAEKDFIWIQTT